MNQSAYAAAAYRSAQSTVPPLTAIVLLYDGILVRIRNARQAAEDKNYERQYNETLRACEILQALNGALDMKNGRDVSLSLRKLYETSIRALLRSVGNKDAVACCERIARGLRNVRDSWAEIAGFSLNEAETPEID